MSTNEEEAIAPVLYELGKAIYISQQFETNLLYVLALLNSKNGTVNEESFLEGFNSHSEKTLGQLVKAFGKKLPLPESFLRFVREGVDLRNRVAHGFVMRSSEKLRTTAGRLEIVNELKDAQYILEQRRVLVEQFLDRCFKVFGGSLDELRQQAVQELNADAVAERVRH